PLARGRSASARPLRGRRGAPAARWVGSESMGRSTVTPSGVRASRTTSRGRRPVARVLLRARREYRHRDAGHVPPGSPRVRRRNAVATGYRSARSDRPWLEVLDVISVPRSLAAPSGKTYV